MEEAGLEAEEAGLEAEEEGLESEEEGLGDDVNWKYRHHLMFWKKDIDQLVLELPEVKSMCRRRQPIKSSNQRAREAGLRGHHFLYETLSTVSDKLTIQISFSLWVYRLHLHTQTHTPTRARTHTRTHTTFLTNSLRSLLSLCQKKKDRNFSESVEVAVAAVLSLTFDLLLLPLHHHFLLLPESTEQSPADSFFLTRTTNRRESTVYEYVCRFEITLGF